MLMDSPLNRVNMLRVYVHTARNVLIEINPQTRIPRTYDRFAALMGARFTISSIVNDGVVFSAIVEQIMHTCR
jgi:rRNA pseudouridine-1189 N-methylase Emg1 (Nep1/Mra1 family)